ncbi:MAG TPA: hypothetical protein VFW23_13495 [Tepidisphaeraceae bacterium]|nr:hypothetical protein [Tepidisphaeraceae bacterium]
MPTTPDLMPEKLERIVPRDAQGYLRFHGWRQFRTSGRLMIFNRPEPDSLDQVLSPVDAARPDFADRMADVVEKLSAFEARSPAAVVTDLLNFDADVLRYRVASRRAEQGTLPLVQAIDLLGGAKQSLLAAAHSTLVRVKHHPKLSRAEAIQLVDACQLNQTEQRSFVVAISCPMRAVDPDEAGLLPGRAPFARRATALLTRALAALDHAIEEDRANSIVDQEQPIVSANLCNALLKMRPQQDDGILEFIPSWAASTPLDADERLPASVAFSADEFTAVEDVYRQLRPAEGPQDKPWIAFVEELRGTQGEDGTREGEVVFTLFDDEELVRARANLTREQYQIAYQAHNPTRPLLVAGQLHRGPRISRLHVAAIEVVPVERLGAAAGAAGNVGIHGGP